MRPVLQALVLAERVYTEESGKKIIVGTFNGIEIARSSPIAIEDSGNVWIKGGTSPGSPSAYISLTDVVAGTTLALQCVSLKRNRVILETQITITGTDRLETVEIVAPLPELRIPESGVYAFEIVCDDEILGSHRLVAKLHEENDPDA